MYLNKEEEKMFNGEYGETIAKNMKIIVALGDIYNAEKLVDINSAQVSGVSFKTIGEAGLEYLEDLAKDKKGVAKIPSTLNPAGMDMDHWKELGFPSYFAIKQKKIVDAYSKLGIMKTCTCTPYLIGNVPKLGDHIAWSESSAVAYVNSVIGAKTNREGGPGALAAAICGKTAMYGYHLDENRGADLLVEVDTKLKGIDYGALGYIVGQKVENGKPYFVLKNKADNNNLKALGAALASSGAVALYHIEDQTPENKNIDKNDIAEKIKIRREDIDKTIKSLTTTDEDADLVCLGCPHASLEEIRDLANFLNGKKIKNNLWICTSINVKSASDRMGFTKTIEKAGGHVVTDTCMVVAPVEDLKFKRIGVNSAKAANYVPSMCGLDVIYDEFENLIKF